MICCPNCGSDYNIPVNQVGRPGTDWPTLITYLSKYNQGDKVNIDQLKHRTQLSQGNRKVYLSLLKKSCYIDYNKETIFILRIIPKDLKSTIANDKSDSGFFDPRKDKPFIM